MAVCLRISWAGIVRVMLCVVSGSVCGWEWERVGGLVGVLGGVGGGGGRIGSSGIWCALGRCSSRNSANEVRRSAGVDR
jgi:hypothetical protein